MHTYYLNRSSADKSAVGHDFFIRGKRAGPGTILLVWVSLLASEALFRPLLRLSIPSLSSSVEDKFGVIGCK